MYVQKQIFSKTKHMDSPAMYVVHFKSFFVFPFLYYGVYQELIIRRTLAWCCLFMQLETGTDIGLFPRSELSFQRGILKQAKSLCYVKDDSMSSNVARCIMAFLGQSTNTTLKLEIWSLLLSGPWSILLSINWPQPHLHQEFYVPNESTQRQNISTKLAGGENHPKAHPEMRKVHGKWFCATKRFIWSSFRHASQLLSTSYNDGSSRQKVG